MLLLPPAGYTADQLTAGLQLAVGLFVLLAALSSPQAWTSLTLESASITPVYAFVTLCVVLQPNLGGYWPCSNVECAACPCCCFCHPRWPAAHPTPTRCLTACIHCAGTASQFVLMRAAGAVVGGLAGLVCMYITYAANGSSYEQSTTKAAVMVACLSAFSFVFGLLRFRFARYWFACTVATFRWVLHCAGLCCAVQRGSLGPATAPPSPATTRPAAAPPHCLPATACSMPMVALNPYHQETVEYESLFYWWLQIALGIGTAALASTFVFPITAGVITCAAWWHCWCRRVRCLPCPAR
jgi:hypothetical protein